MQQELGPVASALAILSATITPAVLISACGSLTISTANRVSRVIERTREVAEELVGLDMAGGTEPEDEEQRILLFDQLNAGIRRTRTLQRALGALYLAIGAFVATSVSIGLGVFVGLLSWLPLVFGGIGGVLLLIVTILLIKDAAHGVAIVNEETDYILRSGQRCLARARRPDGHYEDVCDIER
ncbi:MAG: DUF2721 domain-containing protein [Chloroflexi bacterium]|jgi:hypothetical protein|nr:DUF2721 domain-containing protein [Chloroflexota bacterium]